MIRLTRTKEPVDLDPDDHPTSRLVARLLGEAGNAGASDLHVEPAGGGGGTVRVRIDGFFREEQRLDAELLPRVVARLKVLAGLSVFVTDRVQEGRIAPGALGGLEGDVRLSTIPVLGGERAAVRFFDRRSAPRRLADLGFSTACEEVLGDLLAAPSGALFFVGPCSSGKTTSLYAAAREILARRGGWTTVVSVEDPVEQRVEGVAQTEVAPRRGLTFPAVLRAQLRQDPEVLLVGETRDPETARIAVEAAFTGHLLLTSMHGSGPAAVLRRLALLGVPDHALREALRGVVAQRLLRRLCPDCGGSACEGCRDGYRGRFAVAEVARLRDGEVEPLTPTLEEEAETAVVQGRTTAEEVERVLGGGRNR